MLQNRNVIKQRNLTHEEKLQLKALIGQIQWVSKQTCPDLVFASCDLSNCVKDGTTDDKRLANNNKYLRKLQNSTAQIHLLDIGDVTKSKLYASPWIQVSRRFYYIHQRREWKLCSHCLDIKESEMCC